MAERLVGTNYVTPDIIAKVTGRMLFCKLMLSERPHARVLGIDTRRAMALPGVRAIITADDVPKLGGTAEHCLTNEPLYAGEPILAVAAISEEIAADAIDLIRLDLEPLPFVTDPIESLHPDGPDARTGRRSGTSRYRQARHVRLARAAGVALLHLQNAGIRRSGRRERRAG